MRDCETCVQARPFGGENDNRCSVWECEYINRDEAIKAYKIIKAMREEGGVSDKTEEGRPFQIEGHSKHEQTRPGETDTVHILRRRSSHLRM